MLVGGLRSLGANVGGARHGVFTQRKDELSNDFSVHLFGMNTRWQKSADSGFVLEGRDRQTGAGAPGVCLCPPLRPTSSRRDVSALDPG